MQTRIRDIRKANKLTQAQFASAIGLKRNTICRYERGDRIPSQIVLRAICREFNINLGWLLSGECDMYAKENANAYMPETKAAGFAVSLIRAICDFTPEQLNAIKEKLT